MTDKTESKCPECRGVNCHSTWCLQPLSVTTARGVTIGPEPEKRTDLKATLAGAERASKRTQAQPPWKLDLATKTTPSTEHDPVNSPDHYTAGGIECIDYLEAKLTPEQFDGFCLGNALKYLSRAGKKGERNEDLRKAQWYLELLGVDDDR